ncbi:serine protease, partial [Pandoraea nosoerga]|nr:serine protease [Pandoraea nosoerga]
MIAARPALSRRLRMMGAAISIGAASMLSSAPAFARGPDGIADIAEKLIGAAVTIPPSRTTEANRGGAMPQLPRGSPSEEFCDDFLKNRRGPPGKGGDKSGEFQPRKT